MNAKQLKEINQKTAYSILKILYDCKLWDPVVTNHMSEIQCQNRFYKALDEYFNNHSNIVYWNKRSSINILVENSEVIPMMQEYNFNKYKEDNNL